MAGDDDDDEVVRPDAEMPGDTSTLVPLFAELSSHLASCNFKAIQTFREIQMLLAGSPLMAEMESLEKSVDWLDFDEAGKRLRKVALALDIPDPGV